MSDTKIIRTVFFFFALAITGAFAYSSCAYATDRNIGVVLSDDHGNILYIQNGETPLIPASILKILTSLAAIHILGEDHQFPTDYYFDTQSKDLYIKGFGDPLFISEVIEQLCHDIILTTKTKQINHIILDQTYFSGQIKVPGKGTSLNPYDAHIGALCANFNTIMFKWSIPAGKFVSAEPQTPLLAIFREDIKKTNLDQGRIILSKKQSLLYPGLLIKYFLEKNNIKVTGSILPGTLDKNIKGTRTFLSPYKIKNVVEKLLKYSNNYIANQLLLTMGAKTYQPPATLEKGVDAIKSFSKHSLNLNAPTISEGSGLSRSNLISSEQMIKILIEFLPFHSLLNRQGTHFYKTGTLSNVRTRAGYILGEDDRLYPFVIMVNKKNPGYLSIQKKLSDIVFKKTKSAN